MNDTYKELIDLINYIEHLHGHVTDQWKGALVQKINLKKICVANIYNDTDFSYVISEYIKILNQNSLELFIFLFSSGDGRISSRIKAQNSIEYKLSRYMTPKYENGLIPINKCLNDLFGIRIVLKNDFVHEDLAAFIDHTFGGRYKCIDSSKQEYKATHIYFRESNFSFPWELQIWSESNKKSNLESHHKYKQDYIVWETETKKGVITHD